LKVGIAQISPKLLDVESNLQKHIKYINLAKDEGVDLLVFPELSLTGYLTGWITPLVSMKFKDDIFQRLLEASKGISVIFGGILEERDMFYNAAFFIEDGELKGIHRKVYLPTYGMFDEGRFFAYGWEFKSIESKLGKFGILICEDAWHLDSYLSYTDTDAIVIIANNPLRVVMSRTSIEVWHEIASIPTLFFGIPTIYANRVGVEDGIIFFGGSRVIMGNGDVKAQGSLFKEELIISEIDASITRAAKYKSATLREHLNAIRKNAR